MSTLSSLLAQTDPDYMLLRRPAKVEILSTILLHLFRLAESKEMIDTIRTHLEWTGEMSKTFRRSLQGKGIVQKCMKFYVYDLVVNGPKARPASVYELGPEDETFVKGILKTKGHNILYLKAALLNFKANGYPPRPIKTFERVLGAAYKQLEVTAAKYVHKKFRFLTQSGQMDHEELCSDLVHQAVYSIYRAYPEISNGLHMKNIGIRTIHNRGVNILKEQTTKSRKRLVANEDGTFSGTLLSFSHVGFEASQSVDYTTGGAISVTNHLMTGLDGKSAPYERPTDINRSDDLRRTIDQLGDKLNTPKPKTFIRLLMGEHNSKFSKWLGRPNDEACDAMEPKAYAEQVRQYLGVSVPEAKTFVTQLRTHLKDFRG